jgi:hypothetical protein
MTETPDIPAPRPSAEHPPPSRPPAPSPQRRPLPSPLAVITAGLGLFFIVLTLLAIQVRNGRDPALGPGPAVPTASQPLAKGAQTKQATKIVSRSSPVPP